MSLSHRVKVGTHGERPWPGHETRAAVLRLWPAVLRLWFGAAIVAGVSLAVAATRADVDLWGHVRFGLDILQSGRIDRVDPYSFTSDVPWVNHEWLAEVILGAAWGVAGGVGLIAVKLACTAGALLCVGGTLGARGVTGPGRVMLLGFALVGVLPRITHGRPQLFSVLLFAALLFLLDRSRHGARAGLVWTIPIVALWANLHGGWIVGLATVAAWSCSDVWERRAAGWRASTVLGYPAAAAVASLLNPYGIGLWTFLLETVRFGRTAIDEWGPAWGDPLSLLLWALFAGLAASALARGPRPRHMGAALVCVMWGLVTLQVRRLDAFFALSVIALLGPSLAWLVAARDERSHREPLPMLLRAATIGSVLVLVAAVPPARRVLTCVDMYEPWWPEPEAVAFARQQSLSGRMTTFFRWGEYAIWNLSPALRVSMDGRRETVYSNAVIDGHLSLYNGEAQGLAYLESLHSDYVWLPRELPVSTALRSRGWAPIFEGPRSVMLAPRDVARRFGSVEPGGGADRPSRCFPGP